MTSHVARVLGWMGANYLQYLAELDQLEDVVFPIRWCHQ